MDTNEVGQVLRKTADMVLEGHLRDWAVEDSRVQGVYLQKLYAASEIYSKNATVEHMTQPFSD